MRILDIAVHCRLPPMDGGDRRAWELYKGLGETGTRGMFIGRTATAQNSGPVKQHSPARSWRDRKALTALFAFATGRSYWQVKMFRPGSRRLITLAMQEEYDVVLLNHLYGLPLAKPFIKRRIPLVVDTHNYDPAWFAGVAAASGNPLLSQLCRRAIRNSEKALASLPKDTVLVHVSEADATRYRMHRPDLTHSVVENGTTALPRSRCPDYTGPCKKVLIFVGSLSAQINQDALRHFASCHWPKISEVSEFRVVGLAPPPSIRALCAQQGWALFPDVTEAQLGQLYSEAHFAVLPFKYGEGSKLKFFEACGRGVPILATAAGLCGIADVPDLVTKSDSAEVWKDRILSRLSPAPSDIEQLIAFSELFSWSSLSRKLRQIMDDRAIQHRHPSRCQPCEVSP